MCLPLYFKFVIIPSLQLLLRTVFTSVGFKTSRFHLKISNVNLNFPDLHQRHSRGHGLPEMSLRDRPRSFPLPNCCCLNIELEINAPSLKHFSNPPVSVSCLCDADDPWEHTYAQFKEPTYDKKSDEGSNSVRMRPENSGALKVVKK